jgi:NAD-dependent dihydropyrimidine dehydrogenase PreA subunit
MPVQVNQKECTGCGDCGAACPVEGVLVLENEKAVVAKPDECIECNACVDECPSGAMTMSD